MIVMRTVAFIFTLLLSLHCNAQNSNSKDNIQKDSIMKEIMKLPKFDKEYEVFDREKYSPKEKESERRKSGFSDNYKEYDEHKRLRKYIYVPHDNGDIGEYDYSENPVMSMTKGFYKENNGIKVKGIHCWFGFRIGLWYYYDLEGNLIRTENCDEGFDFTAEDIFKYCIDNNISLERKDEGERTEIRRGVLENGRLVWNIEYPDYKKRKTIHIAMDGKTGKVIEVIERNFPIQ